MKQKIDRNKLMKYRENHPIMTMAATARVFHISRQRVHKILKENSDGRNDAQ
jgi:DNA invertase Pin-like site-specific DNA recombinase